MSGYYDNFHVSVSTSVGFQKLCVLCVCVPYSVLCVCMFAFCVGSVFCVLSLCCATCLPRCDQLPALRNQRYSTNSSKRIVRSTYKARNTLKLTCTVASYMYWFGIGLTLQLTHGASWWPSVSATRTNSACRCSGRGARCSSRRRPST